MRPSVFYLCSLSLLTLLLAAFGPSPAWAMEGSRFLSGDGALGPVLDSVIFAGIAFGVAVLLLWALCKTRLQQVVIPQFDELELISAKHKQGKSIDQAEAIFALACAINGGLRICGVLFLVTLLAVFL